MIARRVFREEDDFAALHAATAALEAAGFSVGRLQRGEPIGLLFGAFNIQKWRNLSGPERRALHGTLHADSYRRGPVDVTLNPGAPPEAVAAFQAKVALNPPALHDGKEPK